MSIDQEHIDDFMYRTFGYKKPLAKASSEPSGSQWKDQSEDWIAPGGEHLRSEKARRFFLHAAFGDAASAALKQKRAIEQHNALYLADKQPRGMGGMFAVPKERRSNFPPNPNPEGPFSAEYGKIAMDPAAAASKVNDKLSMQGRLPRVDGKETQKQAHERVDAADRQALEESLIAHTDPHVVSADPNNARQWKYHGLQNSFAKK